MTGFPYFSKTCANRKINLSHFTFTLLGGKLLSFLWFQQTHFHIKHRNVKTNLHLQNDIL